MIRNGQELTFGNAAQAEEFVVFNRDFIDEELKFDIMPGVVMLSKEAGGFLNHRRPAGSQLYYLPTQLKSLRIGIWNSRWRVVVSCVSLFW